MKNQIKIFLVMLVSIAMLSFIASCSDDTATTTPTASDDETGGGDGLTGNERPGYCLNSIHANLADFTTINLDKTSYGYQTGANCPKLGGIKLPYNAPSTFTATSWTLTAYDANQNNIYSPGNTIEGGKCFIDSSGAVSCYAIPDSYGVVTLTVVATDGTTSETHTMTVMFDQ